ncbi:rRNA maturation RNase YbeY [Psychrobacter frigidicola]|uniref:Endoribonuclease YbeY n=1 Tax=Psychrobacter frigidicola TaxID=45611 RepID=A0A5C7A9P2_9GAMM|nr:rRNA maturation RNase YbeY [Psychrobacter frigidicola]TXD97463.1 rRNA maturation RNase YbeY [Psychrobacter frigidicola]
MGHSNDEDSSMNNIDTNSTDINKTDINEISISAAESIDDELVSTFYTEDRLQPVLAATLNDIGERIKNGLHLPYFTDIDNELWEQKPKALDIYITDAIEGHELNLESRGKAYATNILSYPSEMPANIIELMPTLPLGELIICHKVVVREATEQEKTVEQHISHLLVHGILHLFGFDHELGQAEQDEMESYEIDILAHLNLPNPYV